MNQITPAFDRDDSLGSPRVPAYRAEDLTLGGQTARIMLGDQVYQLRITRLGKLILTK